MINPDGVIIGNNRASLSGNDLNRQFQDPIKYLYPEVYNIRQLIIDSKENNITPFMFVDMHGHSLKKYFFMYSNYFPIHD